MAENVRIGAGRQIDELVAAIAADIDRVVSAGIPDGEDRHAGPVGGEVEDVAPGIGIVAVGRVPGPRRHVGAVDRLDRRDVIDHRRRGIVIARIGRARRPGVGVRVIGAEIRHDRIFALVLGIFGVRRVGDRAAAAGIVGAGMGQAERVPDLVQIGLEAVAAEIHVDICVVGIPGAVGPDLDPVHVVVEIAVLIGPGVGHAIETGIGAATAGVVRIFELDLGAGGRGAAGEIDVDQLVPELEG